MGVFHSTKLSKIWKQRQMVHKNVPEKFPKMLKNCWISGRRTFQPKILEIAEAKLNGNETSGKTFRKFYTTQSCPLFKNFGKCCTIRYWKWPKIQTGLFLGLNGNRPVFTSWKVLYEIINPLLHKCLKSLVFSVLCCKGYETPALSKKLYLVHDFQWVTRTSLVECLNV